MLSTRRMGLLCQAAQYKDLSLIDKLRNDEEKQFYDEMVKWFDDLREKNGGSLAGLDIDIPYDYDDEDGEEEDDSDFNPWENVTITDPNFKGLFVKGYPPIDSPEGVWLEYNEDDQLVAYKDGQLLGPVDFLGDNFKALRADVDDFLR